MVNIEKPLTASVVNCLIREGKKNDNTATIATKIIILFAKTVELYISQNPKAIAGMPNVAASHENNL
jgi:hypothetical protein